MSRLEELILKYDYTPIVKKPLGTLCKIETGKLNANEAVEDGEYAFFTTARKISRINKYRWDTEALLIAGNANIGEIKYFKGKFEAYQRTYVLTQFADCINVRFLYFCLSNNLKKYLENHKNEAAMTYIVLGTLQNFAIPVPPLEVQCEIVRILESFTELTAELTTELAARKIQYQTYLDNLLDNCNAEEKYLNQIGTLTRGKRFVHADTVKEDGIPCIHYGELYTYYGVFANKAKSQIRKSILSEKKLRYANKGDVIIVGAGENSEDIGVGVAWEGDYPVAVHDACYTFVTNQNPRFISFYLRSRSYHNQIKRSVSEGKICAISSEGIGKAKLKVPSLDEQEKIVKKLERFYILTNDISEGLPAEIEGRKKQYEYYREYIFSMLE